MAKIGLDIGFGDVKVAIPNRHGDRISIRTLKFPTAIGTVNRGIVDLGSSNGYKQYVYQNEAYYLGADALYCQDIFDTRDREFLEKFSPLLAFKALENIRLQDRRDNLILCVGIPIGYFKDHSKNISRILGNISVNDHVVNPKVVDVRAQGQGVYFDYLFDNSGAIDKSKLNINALVLDIGFNTIDILGVVGGRPVTDWSDMFTKKGVSRIIENLRTYVKKEFGKEVSEQKMCRIFENRQITISGQVHDLSKVINEFVDKYTGRLVQFIKASKWNEFLDDADNLIIAGGGAYYVADAFKDLYPDGFVVVPPAPEFSNARGFLKYSIFRY